MTVGRWICRLTLGVALFWGNPLLACSATTDCTVTEGTYRIVETPGAIGALVFAHGYHGRASSIVTNEGLRTLSRERNLHLVALQSAGDDWAIRNAPTDGNFVPRDETAYVQAVLTDLSERFGSEVSRSILAGFSAGGMLVSEIACAASTDLNRFIAIAGTVWAPVPATCNYFDGRFIHIHGTKDEIVPMEGRAIADALQGDVQLFLNVLATVEVLDCPQNVPSGRVALCLTEHGHAFRVDELQHAISAVMNER